MADVSESQWNLVPENSAWSLQTTAAEILNYEIKTLNKFTDLSIKEVSEEFTHHEFVVAQTKNTNHLVNELRKENESQGFIYHDKNSIKPSLHWIMIRTIQHSIYHSGGISVLRHLVGLQRGSYDHWEPMVDSVFLAGISLE